MKGYIEDVKSFLRNRTYMFCVIILAIISFGYAVFNTSISPDDLDYDRYVGSGNVMLASGRFGIWFWSFIEGKWENSYLIDIIAIFFLIFAAINFCVLFRRVSNYKIGNAALTVFSCMFVTYPLMLEIWEYTGANVNICGAFLFVSLSLLLIHEQIHKGSFKKPWRLIPACLMMMIVCAGYESVVSVYIFFVFAILALQVVYGSEKEKKFSQIIRQGLIYAGVLVVGLLLRVIVHKIILAVLGLEATTNGETQIMWGTKPALEIVKKLIIDFILYYITRGIVYFPLTILVVSGVVFIILGIIACKKHGIVLLLPGFGMLFSLVALSFVQGQASPYRTCQVFAAFVAFTALLLVNSLPKGKKNWLRIAVLIVCGYVCFCQATYINYFLELNHRRSENEAQVIRQIGVDLQRDFDREKPVIFVGYYEVDKDILEAASVSKDSLAWKAYKKVYLKFYELMGSSYNEEWLNTKLPETNVNSAIRWSIESFGQESMPKLFSYYGYDYVPADFWSVYDEATEYAKSTNMPTYPEKDYIQDVGEYIIVNLE